MKHLKSKVLVIGLFFSLFIALVFAIQTVDVIPNLNATYDLGNSTHMYRDLWLSRNAFIGGMLNVSGMATFDNLINATQNISVGENINLNSSIRSIHSGTYVYYNESGTFVVHIEG